MKRSEAVKRFDLVETERLMLRRWRETDRLWALDVRNTGQFIGFTGLAPMQEDVPGAGGTEIGWRLARYAWRPRR